MFGRAFRLPFRILGIPLELDWTFLVILPLLAWIIAGQVPLWANTMGIANAEPLTEGWTPWLLGFAGAVGLFVSVLIHEMGHAVVARAYGVQTRAIRLWFLGGVAQFDDLPRGKGAEAVVAFVGPVVSFMLGIVLIATAQTLPWPLWAYYLLMFLASMNFIIAVFNLIPALPLDGGRVLRSMLAIWMPALRATEITAVVSRILAIGLGILGLMSLNFFLLAVAVFVYLAVQSETRTMQVEELLRGVPIWRLMNQEVRTVPADMTIGQLTTRMLEERHLGFPVVEASGKVVGMVGVLEVHGQEPGTPVGSVMNREILTVNADEEAVDAFRLMSRNNFGRVVVLEEVGQIAGIVTKTDLMRFLQVRALRAEMAGEPTTGVVGHTAKPTL